VTGITPLRSLALVPGLQTDPVKKADRELLALKVVYNPSELEKLEPGDKPDFVLAKRHGPEFGVEVTDLYQSEANARLVNVPGYAPRLFTGGPHMHRDDVDILKVVRFDISDKDGNPKQADVPGVAQERLSTAGKHELLAEALREKARKYAGYKTGLSHTNLIVVDHIDWQQDPSESYSTNDLLGSGVREALADSPFQEVFLVAWAPDGQAYYRPLRQIMLLEQFRVFAHCLESFEPELHLQMADITPLFVRVMQGTSLLVHYAIEDGKDWAVGRGCAVRLGEDGGMNVYDYGDYRTTAEFTDLPALPVSPVEFEAFVRYQREIASTSGMRIGYHAPAATPELSDEVEAERSRE
jgi:hypothetical protein